MKESLMSNLPEKLSAFVDEAAWVFAKTYAATWPHEYIVRERVDEKLFAALAEHIQTQGYAGKFYKMDITYFDHGDRVYWTMGEAVGATKIINRCEATQTYSYRLAHDDLPEQKPRR